MNLHPSSGRRVLRGCILVVVASLCGADGRGAPDAGTADAGTMIVTSDSGAYCRALSNTIGTHGVLPREVRELKAEGDGLCEGGRIRRGIARLRRALLALHGPAAAPPRP